MRGIVTIDNREIEMAANAASPYIYNHIFHEDFLKKLTEKEPAADLFQKMGFVMSEQGKGKPMSELMNLTMDDFYTWLSQFDPVAVLLATPDISNLYMGQTVQASVPKNEGV